MGVLLRSVENFLSQSAEKIGGNHSKFQKIGVPKNFMHKKGISLFSVESFLSQSAKKFMSFKKILLSKNFIHRTGRGGIIALSKFFCFT